MPKWSRHPTIFEINTWVWLSGVSQKHGVSQNLAYVHRARMGRYRRIRLRFRVADGCLGAEPRGYLHSQPECGPAGGFPPGLPDFGLPDNVGSPYCVRRYEVDPQLGGPGGLEIARKELAKRGMRLLLDFVPNHVAPDHRWVIEHPEYLIRGTADDVRNDPSSFLTAGGSVFACGRDPYFPA
jgi:hypothetical protein